MCVVSAMGDHYRDKWGQEKWVLPDPLAPYRLPVYPVKPTTDHIKIDLGQVSREEFDKLKRDVEEMKEVLKVAKKYDEDNDEPDCEIDEKIGFLKKVAEAVGVDLEEVFGADYER